MRMHQSKDEAVGHKQGYLKWSKEMKKAKF